MPNSVEMTFEEALGYTHSLEVFGSRPGLSRIGAVCRALGDPQETLRVIHVAGTNGKGSTCAFLAEALRAAGYSVGLYTSPYITCFEERIRLNGECISPADYAAAATRVKAAQEEIGETLTEFEFITAAAFVYYAQKAPDYVVLEVGMGGRLDATNLITRPQMCVITSVSLDHIAVLGDTVEQIAHEKCGILKSGCPAVLAPDNPDSVRQVVTGEARKKDAPLWIAPAPENISCDQHGTSFTLAGEEYALTLLGAHQASNAAAAVTALKRLGIPAQAIRRGLWMAQNPARLEVIRRDPLLLLDGGHNEGGGKALRNALDAIAPEESFVALLGMMRDKDVTAYLGAILPRCRRVYTLRAANPRSLTAEELAQTVRSMGVEAIPLATSRDELLRVLKEEAAFPILCGGSLYLASELRPILLEKD